MKVEQILRRKGDQVKTIAPETGLKTAAHKLLVEDISSLVVISNGEIVGLLTEREIARGLARHGEELAQMKVRDIMSEHVVACTPDDDLRRVMTLMTQHRVRHLPVIEHGRLSGIVSIGDVVKYRLEELELETNVLRDAYIASH
jgi:CBS domain-containing protein